MKTTKENIVAMSRIGITAEEAGDQNLAVVIPALLAKIDALDPGVNSEELGQQIEAVARGFGLAVESLIKSRAAVVSLRKQDLSEAADLIEDARPAHRARIITMLEAL